MNRFLSILLLSILLFISSCTNDTPNEKGFQVGTVVEEYNEERPNGLSKDSVNFETRPGGVLLTGIQNVRITPVYKVNFNKRDKIYYTGSNSFHYRYDDEQIDMNNNWHQHLMPGLEAMYGYNMINISHYSIKEQVQKEFFERPVLVRTLYYPSFEKDTLNQQPVTREFFLVSVYNQDTNKDGFINLKDLRRLFLFNLQGMMQRALVPENYAVMSSEYDPANDLMFVSAQLDANKNGQQEANEPIHIFWINLKDPTNTGRMF